ncbi:hypothetical protein [Streptomyces polyrhachis]|uniref:hypothetical protein n=1 Tax=Streptomyces polyrhachis TaxID=1282885 RepID=UPI0036D7DAB8
MRASVVSAAVSDLPELTTVDRYYHAWLRYTEEHDREPNGQELSEYLTEQRARGLGSDTAKPSTLRRYLLGFRIYQAWQDLAETAGAADVDPDALVDLLAQRGITGQYRAALVREDFTEAMLTDFQRRYAALRTYAAG